MNLLIINSAKQWGGTEKWALYTAYGLAAMGHKVYFGCRGNLFTDRAMNNNVIFVKFPFTNNADFVTVFKIRSFLIKNKIDIVLPSKQREYFLAGIAAKLAGVKVAGIYGMDRPIHNFRNWIVFCKLFDIVIVNAAKIIQILGQTKAFDTAKCKLVYVGVEPITLSDQVRLDTRQSLGLKENEICLMGIGRIAPQKGFDYAIRALALLVKKCPEVKLVLVGDGDIEFYRKIAVECNVEKNVVFTGFRTDIHELVQAMDIFWLPSRSEGIPNTMLEAMCAHKPVVVFDIAGITEVIKNGQNGIVVPFEDINNLYESTAMLIENKSEMKRLGDAGYTTVTEEYSMEKMCKDTEKQLLKLLSCK
jgi:glycosyltransferase involved in cell wall biosynthesis